MKSTSPRTAIRVSYEHYTHCYIPYLCVIFELFRLK